MNASLAKCLIDRSYRSRRHHIVESQSATMRFDHPSYLHMLIAVYLRPRRHLSAASIFFRLLLIVGSYEGSCIGFVGST